MDTYEQGLAPDKKRKLKIIRQIELWAFVISAIVFPIQVILSLTDPDNAFNSSFGGLVVFSWANGVLALIWRFVSWRAAKNFSRHLFTMIIVDAIFTVVPLASFFTAFVPFTIFFTALSIRIPADTIAFVAYNQGQAIAITTLIVQQGIVFAVTGLLVWAAWGVRITRSFTPTTPTQETPPPQT